MYTHARDPWVWAYISGKSFVPILQLLKYYGEMHVQIKHSLVYLQDLIPTLAGAFAYILFFTRD